MRTLTRSNPFNELSDFRREFDQMFNRMTAWPWAQNSGTGASGFLPMVDAYVDKDGKKYHCRVTLPGVKPQDVQIHTQGNTLTISGERKEERSMNEIDFLAKEISYGSFERSLALPEGIDVDKLTAEYHDGVLEITGPIAASALPRRVEITSGLMSKSMTA